MTEYIFRKETPEDWKEVENLTREAFWDVYAPGCDEHLIVHNLRGHQDTIEELNHVVEYKGRIVGHIFYTRARIVYDGGEQQVLWFGPISVLPELQRKGVGSLLIRRTLPLAKDMGFPGVVITGNPAYYHRFGFDDAAKVGVVGDDGWSSPELMALEFTPGALHAGAVHFSPLYNVDRAQLEEFEKLFVHKDKRKPLPTDLYTV